MTGNYQVYKKCLIKEILKNLNRVSRKGRMKHPGLSKSGKAILTPRPEEASGREDKQRSVAVEESYGLWYRELTIDFLRTSKANQGNK